MGFSKDVELQRTPVQLKELKNIKKVKCGANFCLALDDKGAVYAWGSGQQCELGRKLVERSAINGLIPSTFGLKKTKKEYIVDISCGANHAFAIDNNDNIWAWGSNNMGQTGIMDNAGEGEGAVIEVPTKVEALSRDALQSKIVKLDGGNLHSIAVTEDGKCRTWGRVDGGACGVDIASLPKEKLIYNERDEPKILKEPTAVLPGMSFSPPSTSAIITAADTLLELEFASAAAGPGHSVMITKEGKAYSCGLNNNFQLGQGIDGEDVMVATIMRGSQITDAIKFTSVDCAETMFLCTEA